MKNNKGFTIIEVAVSFVLVATISITLLQLIMSLKEVYLTGDVKTTLLNKQGILIKYIYDDLENKDLTSITSCGLSCLTFSYSDNTSKDLLVDPGNNTISYGDYTMQNDNSCYFEQLTMNIDESSPVSNTTDDSIFTLDIPITSKLLNDENFGIRIVKTYNRGKTLIDINKDIAATTVTLSGINTELSVIPGETNDIIEGIFEKLYHQTANNYFGNGFNNFIKNKNVNTFSTLTSMEAFRMKNNLAAIIAEQESGLKDNEKALLKQSYQNGYFSLLLNYNDLSLSSGRYSWWYQTSNIASKEELDGFYPIENIGNGLQFEKNNTYWGYIIGKPAAIGLKSGTIYDMDGNTATSVDLYAEAREYVCKYSLSNITYNGNGIKSLSMFDGTSLCPESIS